MNYNSKYKCLESSDIKNNICDIAPEIIIDTKSNFILKCPEYSTYNETTKKCNLFLNKFNAPSVAPSSAPSSAPSGAPSSAPSSAPSGAPGSSLI
jgi:hypothetical protein